MKKVLLDENLPYTLRRHLGHHETMTAAYAGLAGLKNGQLPDAAVEMVIGIGRRHELPAAEAE